MSRRKMIAPRAAPRSRTRRIAFRLLTVILAAEVGLQIAALALRAVGPAPPPIGDGDAVVICVGDSFTYGIGAPPDARYPLQLEALLNERFPGVRWQTVTAARPGSNSSQQLRRLAEAARPHRPRLVLVQSGCNNRWNIAGRTFVHGDAAGVGARIDAWGTEYLRLYRLLRWGVVGVDLTVRLPPEERTVEAPSPQPAQCSDEDWREITRARGQVHEFRQRGEIEAARALTRTLDERFPDNYVLLSDVGWLHHQDGRIAEMRALFERVDALAPDWATGQWGLSYAQALAGDRAAARAHGERAFLRDGDLARLLVQAQSAWFAPPAPPAELFAYLDRLRASARAAFGDVWVRRRFDPAVAFARDAARWGEVLHADLAAMQRMTDQCGARLVVLTYPTGIETERIVAIARRLALPVVRVDQAFHARFTAGDAHAEWLAEDGHPNARGYRLEAEVICDFLEAQGIVHR